MDINIVINSEEDTQRLIETIANKISNMSPNEVASYYFDMLMQLKRKDKEIETRVNEEKNKVALSFARVLREVLLVFDNEHTNCNSLIKSIEMLKSKLENEFAKNNIDIIRPFEGENFDEKLHDVIGTVVCEDPSFDGKIASCVSPGISIENKVVLPAQVLVYAL